MISLESEEDVNRQTISSLKCSKCDVKQFLSYADGDYIFKVKEKCPKCNENLQITEIYSVKLAEQSKEKK